MSLVGNLEDLPLTDILQIVSLSRKSGVLGLARQGIEGKIFFSNGLVIAAKVSDFPLDLGQFLSRKGLLTAADQVQIRERVRHGESLGAILHGELGISEKIVDGFAKAGIEKVVYRLFTWKDGNFHFDLKDGSELEVVLEPFLPYLPAGINPQFLAMEGARLKDESDYFTTRSGLKPKTQEQPSPRLAPAPVPKAPVPASLAPSPIPGTKEPVAIPEQILQTVAPPVEEATPAQAESSDEEAQRQNRPSTKGKPLLVVVDNDVVALKNMEIALQKSGFEVAAFNRVDGAIKAVRELLRKGRGLVVLADLVMPKRDASGMLGGLEVLEVLRGEDQHVPIVIMADLNNPEAEKRAEELATDGYLSKPGRKYYIKDADNTFPEFHAFIATLCKEIDRLGPKASVISASNVADPFVDLGRELQGELEAATTAVSAGAPSSGSHPAEKSRGLNLLKEMVRELSDPQFNADVSLLILRFASELMSRAVIFVVGQNEVIGLGQAGVDRPDANAVVRGMRIPLGEPSLFADVVKMKTGVRRKLDSTRWNRYLLESLGGIEPAESFAAPIFTSKRLAAIVYGDNAGDNKSIGDVDSLEIFLSHAGIAMERALLERRIRDLTSGRRINYSD